MSVEDAPAPNPSHPSGAAQIDWADYALVLSRVVDGDSIRRPELRGSGPQIDHMLAQLSDNGPRSSPASTQSTRAAFYINAHNLLMLAEMRSLDLNSFPRTWPPTLTNARRHRIDGRSETVHTLAAKARDAAGDDWRVRMALFTGRRDGPPLWNRPLLADMLDIQLDEITRAAVASPRVVRIDHGVVKQLLLAGELYDVREALIRDYERRMHTDGATILSVLLEQASPFHRQTLNSAVGYKVARLPEDRRLPTADSRTAD